MKFVWTWGGDFFGFISDDYLFTKRGKSVGILSGKDIFDRQGKYIGEVMDNNRLITCKTKKGRRGPMAPHVILGACGSQANVARNVMYAGYEDFPSYKAFG